MIHSTLVKICGITTPEMAVVAANAGADFIGIVFHADSKRYVTPQTAKLICEAVQNTRANVVGVFTDHKATEILRICQYTGIRTVQLHGATSKSGSNRLPQYLKRIYALSVSADGYVLDDDKENISLLDKTKDYLLFDNINPGTGTLLPTYNFKCDYDLPFFLAGGLNINNVQNVIKDMNPNGVDISSGVEDGEGNKSEILIKNFIESVKRGKS